MGEMKCYNRTVPRVGCFPSSTRSTVGSSQISNWGARPFLPALLRPSASNAAVQRARDSVAGQVDTYQASASNAEARRRRAEGGAGRAEHKTQGQHQSQATVRLFFPGVSHPHPAPAGRVELAPETKCRCNRGLSPRHAVAGA